MTTEKQKIVDLLVGDRQLVNHLQQRVNSDVNDYREIYSNSKSTYKVITSSQLQPISNQTTCDERNSNTESTKSIKINNLQTINTENNPTNKKIKQRSISKKIKRNCNFQTMRRIYQVFWKICKILIVGCNVVFIIIVTYEWKMIEKSTNQILFQQNKMRVRSRHDFLENPVGPRFLSNRENNDGENMLERKHEMIHFQGLDQMEDLSQRQRMSLKSFENSKKISKATRTKRVNQVDLNVKINGPQIVEQG